MRIKYENQKLLVNKGAINERRKKYFWKLFNGHGEINIMLWYCNNPEKYRNYMFYGCICPKEVKKQ